MYPTGKAHLGDIDAVGDWVSLQRNAIASLLAEGRDAEIKTLLEQSLNNIRDIITPPIESYQERVTEVRQGKVGYEVAIECSEDLQRRLIRFFRNSVLLFHPDKSDRNEELRCLQTELFKEFKQLSDTSLETIRAGLQTLKQCIPKWKLEHQAILEKMQRDREAFRARLKKEMKTLAESNAKLNASLKELIEEGKQDREESKQYREEMKQDREEMKQDREEMKQDREKMKQDREKMKQSRKEMREQIECIKNDLLAQNLGLNQDPMPEERPGTSTPFSARR
jgi:chromosome segregation ATPase